MPTKTAYMQKLAASRRRDAVGRFAWSELSEKERAEIRHAVPRLYEVHNLGDIGVAELLYALGMAGVLDKLGVEGAEGADKPVVWPVETRGGGVGCGALYERGGTDRRE